MIGFVDVTPERAAEMLSSIQEAQKLASESEAFVYALKNQDMWTKEREAMVAWYTFIEGGRKKLPEEVVNYHAIISGVSAR